MPDLDLGDLSSLDLTSRLEMSGPLGTAAFRLLAYMGWPSNERRRNEYLANLGAMALAEIERAGPAAFGVRDEQHWHRALALSKQRHFDLYGGFNTLTTAPPYSAITAEWDHFRGAMLAAGKILLIIRSVVLHHPDARGGASVNKAVFLLEHVRPRVKRTVAKQMWSRYKSVAPLCATLCIFSSLLRQAGATGEQEKTEFMFAELGMTLAIARELEDFATTFVPHGHSAPLLDRSKLWTIPADLRLPPVEIPMPPLPGHLLDALRKYSAPQSA